ncbi:hypothetical protein PDJAM_G00143260 [Pangasius djambal]|uniref:Uncharacterized protein n=1 Tax=Pangasius djambal TaxID=1691987 RepID=A0ACC5ZGF5_9TELE|nr:hypothetical protein [Pangasius djambal]
MIQTSLGTLSLMELSDVAQLKALYIRIFWRCTLTSRLLEERAQVLSREITPGEPIDVYLPLTDLVEVSFTATDAAQPSDLQICTVNAQVLSREITPGEPIDVYLPLTDLVEVSFTATDAAQPSDLQICTVNNEKIWCSPDYKERASRINTLQIKEGHVSDSGNYTVRDVVNNETLAIVKVRVRDCKGGSGAALVSQTHSLEHHSVSEEKPCPDCKQDRAMPAWEIALIVVLVILLIVAGLVIGYLWKQIQQLRGESADRHQPLQMTENTNQHQQNGTNGHTDHSPEDVEISVHTALTNPQH